MPFAETFSNLWSNFIGWVKRHTTSEALMDGLRTGAWVVPLTILIWIYAEEQQHTTEDNQTVLLNVRTSDPESIVNLIGQNADVAMISMEGPKASIDAAKELLNRPERMINIDVDPKLPPGQIHDIAIASAIEDAALFTQRGIKVTQVKPDRISVKLDEMEQHDIEIVPPADANLDGPATFQPKTITLRAPSEMWKEARTHLNTPELKAICKIPAMGDLARPGPHDAKLEVDLPLKGENVSPSTNPTCVASYSIKQTSIKDKIPSLMIKTLSPGSLANDLVIELQDSVLTDCAIVGPPEKVRKVISNSQTNTAPIPYAILSIDATDVDDIRRGAGGQKTLNRKLTYDLGDPDVLPADPSRTVDVIIRKRGTPPQ
jgi:hypothetical protein